MPMALPLAVQGELPSFDGATEWLNSGPLTSSALRGKVVLVNFWTYSCINWIRQLPHVRAWAERYGDRGLVVIGVHTPEFAFEHEIENVRGAAREMTVDYPIAIDSNYAIWRAFSNEYWPALYLADAQGRIRHRHFGEGDYDRSETIIQQLLEEAGADGLSREHAAVDANGVEAAADWDALGSPETYLGYARTENLASPDQAVLDRPHVYAAPPRLRVNEWSLAGDWTLESEAAMLNSADGRVAYRLYARDLHLVMGAANRGAEVRFRVLLDGEPPQETHGIDIDEQGEGRVTQPRLYQLIRQSKPITERTFEIMFLDPGVRAYVFTFG